MSIISAQPIVWYLWNEKSKFENFISLLSRCNTLRHYLLGSVLANDGYHRQICFGIYQIWPRTLALTVRFVLSVIFLVFWFYVRYFAFSLGSISYLLAARFVWKSLLSPSLASHRVWSYHVVCACVSVTFSVCQYNFVVGWLVLRNHL